MKFDRNQSVESDLTFWARFVSQGAPVLNLGQGPVEDLLLDGPPNHLAVPDEGRRDLDPRRALAANGPADHRGLRTIRVGLVGLANEVSAARAWIASMAAFR